MEQWLSDEQYTGIIGPAITASIGSFTPGNTSGAVIATDNSVAVDELFGYTARDFDTAVGLQYNRAS